MQPSQLICPNCGPKTAPTENSTSAPIGNAENGVATMKPNDIREIGLVRQKSVDPHAVSPAGPQAPRQAQARHTPTPVFSMPMASSVQFPIPPESRPQRTNLPNPAQPRTTGAPSSQNPAPARKARPPLHFSANFVTIVDHRPRTVRSASHDQRLGTNETKNQSEDQRKTVYR